MKFVTPSKFTDPDDGARKLLEIANGIDADHAGGGEVGWPRNRRRSSSSLSRSMGQITTTTSVLLKGHSSQHSSGSKAIDSGCWPQSLQVRSSPGSGLGLGVSLILRFEGMIRLPPLGRPS